jgi:hypothetical protein
MPYDAAVGRARLATGARQRWHPMRGFGARNETGWSGSRRRCTSSKPKRRIFRWSERARASAGLVDAVVKLCGLKRAEAISAPRVDRNYRASPRTPAARTGVSGQRSPRTSVTSGISNWIHIEAWPWAASLALFVMAVHFCESTPRFSRGPVEPPPSSFSSQWEEAPYE